MVGHRFLAFRGGAFGSVSRPDGHSLQAGRFPSRDWLVDQPDEPGGDEMAKRADRPRRRRPRRERSTSRSTSSRSPTTPTGRRARRTSSSSGCAASARSTGAAAIEQYPEEEGFWSVTTADDVHTVSRDWKTYSSAQGITALTHSVLPLELQQAMFIGMDPPKHDRLKALFQRGFTPKRIADHEEAIRAITDRRPRRPRRPRDLRPRHRRRPAGRLARDPQLHGDPAGGRRRLGAAHELGPRRQRPRPQPGRASRRSWSGTSRRSSSAAAS